MVEAELGLLEMKLELVLADAVELSQPVLGEPPRVSRRPIGLS